MIIRKCATKSPQGCYETPYGAFVIPLWGVCRPPMGRPLVPNEKRLFGGMHADNYKNETHNYET
jgi:hypothetical protein